MVKHTKFKLSDNRRFTILVIFFVCSMLFSIYAIIVNWKIEMPPYPYQKEEPINENVNQQIYNNSVEAVDTVIYTDSVQLQNKPSKETNMKIRRKVKPLDIYKYSTTGGR